MGFTSFNATHSSEHFSGRSSEYGGVEIDAIRAVTDRSESIVLPPIQSEAFISQRHEVNPALALNVLKDIHAKVSTWQLQQRQIVQAMRVLYEQGPMVDGWLQSSAQMASAQLTPGCVPTPTVLRHGDTAALMQYIEAIERDHAEAGSSLKNKLPLANSNGSSDRLSHTHHYYLCSLTTEGNVRSQPCPPAQMAMVSTAIARYQKFKQLASQKQTIESKLQQAVDSLTAIRANL